MNVSEAPSAPRVIPTSCYACHGGCSVLAEVDADGRVRRLRPDPTGPLNHGRMCPKGLRGTELLYHPDHLNVPLRRVGERGSGQWEPIGWDEALDTICERFTALRDRYGAGCVSVLTGTGRHLKNQVARFANVLGTPNMASTGAAICFGPRVNAMMLTCGAYAVTDYYSGTWPGCVLVWGSNPLQSGPDGKLRWNLREAQSHGTKLIIIDPLPTELTDSAALWLRPLPGTDGALALALLRELLENDWIDHAFTDRWCTGLAELKEACRPWTAERAGALCRLEPEDIRRCARLLWENGPVGLDWGCAVEQTPNAFCAIRAMAMIPILLGSWDVPGGFREGEELCPECDPFWDRFDRSDRFGAEYVTSPYAHVIPILRSMSSNRPDRIRAALIFGTNPLLCVPDARQTRDNLLALEFSVCMDQFMTPTAALCDLVLPAASWMEIDNVYPMPAMAEHTALAQTKLTRVAERRSDGEVFMAICRRLGLDYGADSTEELLESQLAFTRAHHPEFAELTLASLQQRGHIEVEPTFRRYEQRGGFATPDGKIQLSCAQLARWGMDPVPVWRDYPQSDAHRPFRLTTGRRQSGYFISENRQIPSLRAMAPFPRVLMHPNAAARLSIREGDWVRIETDTGSIVQKAHLLPGGDEDVVNCEMGWWYPEAGPDTLYGWDESNCNVLIPDSPQDPNFGSYALRGLRCSIAPAPEGRYIEERYYASLSR